MKSTKKNVFLLIIISVLSSCFQDKTPKNVNSFYIKKYYLDYPVIPLSNPVFAYYVKEYDEWSFEIPNSFKNNLHIENLNKIGVDENYIYGKISKKNWTVRRYESGDYVYAHRYGGTTLSKEPFKSQDDIRVYPLDSTSKTFLLPERWFVINVIDSTTEAFFSKSKYDDYLKTKGVSGKMYDINKYHKQFKETGILPWFPDSIKTKLKK
jgi:hypothetical protein